MSSSLAIVDLLSQKSGLFTDTELYGQLEEAALVDLGNLEFKISQKGDNPQKLVKYRTVFQNIASLLNQAEAPFRPGEEVQQKIQNLGTVLIGRCIKAINKLASKFYRTRKFFFCKGVLERAFPTDADEISSFITRKILRHILEKRRPLQYFTGKSLSFPFFSSSGDNLLIKFRLYDKKPQVLVSRFTGQGIHRIATRVAVVLGPPIKGAPSPIFTRLKLKDEWKHSPEVLEATRRGCEISQRLNQQGAKHILQYNIISQRPNGATLATPFYEDDVFSWLAKLPPGRVSLKDTQFFLGQIAIPAVAALCYFHSNNLVHLDFRAENLLLSEQGKLGVADLGSWREKGTFHKESFIPFFAAAPEIFKNQSWRAGPKIDIYACGVLFVNFLLGLIKGRITPTRQEVFNILTLEQKTKLQEFCSPITIDVLLSLLTCDQKLFLLRQGLERIKKELKTLSLSCGSKNHYLDQFCALTCRCLSENQEERPTTEELLTELQQILGSLPRANCGPCVKRTFSVVSKRMLRPFVNFEESSL